MIVKKNKAAKKIVKAIKTFGGKLPGLVLNQ